MKVRRLRIAGFGRLTDTEYHFDDALNVVHGLNEAGKSTLAAAIVASLYGIGRRRDFWRPWNGGPYGTTLVYELADGRTFEVQRDFARDAKGVRIYDRDGNDVAGEVTLGRAVAPGEVHLRVPLEAFVNASCVLQQTVEIDGTRNAAIASALAQALDGGPKEDAALGALKRLDEARRTYVGTARATVNNPLRQLREALTGREAELRAARTARDDVAGRRERRAAVIEERDRLVERRSVAEGEAKAVRAAELRERLDQLRFYRDDLAALQAERLRSDDVATFPADGAAELDVAYYAWQVSTGAAEAAEGAADDAKMSTVQRAELAARRADVGSLGDVEYEALFGAAERAEEARATATSAAGEAAAARREGQGGRSLAGAGLAVAAVFGLLTIAFAIAHWWSFTEVCAFLAAIAFAAVGWRGRERRRRERTATEKQRIADAALAAERAAAATVAAVLARLGLANVGELARRRERLAELERAAELAERALARAVDLRAAELAAAAVFDELADALVADVSGPRDVRRAAAAERGRRRRERDGVDNGIAMLSLRRNEILRGDDEFALVGELDALTAAGIVPAEVERRGLGESLAAQIGELQRMIHEADLAIERLGAEVELGEAALPALAPLEESVTGLKLDLARLEAFERALTLAEETIERRTHEAHQAFARRLETYAADMLHAVTDGRYAELRVDPTSLLVRVRVPETEAILDLDVLSAGTRDQVYLVVRLAMARMFAEGLELPPLLLDDPFAFWDAERIERCLPIIAHNAFGAQTILFTASRDLADAAQAVGAHSIDLSGQSKPRGGAAHAPASLRSAGSVR